jgi:hypothetical protein
MSADYHLWLEEQAKGPFTLGQLRAMWNAGQITSETSYTADAGNSWKHLSEIINELEPASPLTGKSEPRIVSLPSTPPRQTSKTKRTIGIFLIILPVLIIVGILCCPAVVQSTLPKNPTIPAPIKLELDNFENTTNTGISLQDYPALIIALKTSISTAGDTLTTDQQKELGEITSDMDMSNQLWRVAHIDSYNGNSYIDLGDNFPGQYANLRDWLTGLHVNLEDLKRKDSESTYLTGLVMSHVWGAIGTKIDLFELKYNLPKN